MASIRTIQRAAGTRYEVRINRAGRAVMSKSFDTLKAAKEWSNKIETKIDRGQKVSRKAETILFSEACADFIDAWRPAGGGEIPEHKQLIIQVLANDKALKDRTMASFSHDTLQNFVEQKSKTLVSEPERKKKLHPLYNGAKRRTYAAATVRHYYFALKQVLTFNARREAYSLDSNLFGQILPGAWEGRRTRRLEDGELDALKEAAKHGYEHKGHWPLLIDLALATAARSQELLKANWTEINFDGRAWNIPADHVKTSTFRQVPLSKKALEALRAMELLKKDEEPRIFHAWRDSRTISKGFRRLTARAKVGNFRFHDLRHEATSRLFEATTLSDIEIMAMTGHTNPMTLRGYLHLRASYVADKLDKAA